MYQNGADAGSRRCAYIRYNRKVIIVKYGGSAMVDQELKMNVIKDVVLAINWFGFKPIIVHRRRQGDPAAW